MRITSNWCAIETNQLELVVRNLIDKIYDIYGGDGEVCKSDNGDNMRGEA